MPPFMIVVAEYYFNVSIVDKPVDQAGGEFNVVAHVMVVKFQEMRILAAKCEAAGR